MYVAKQARNEETRRRNMRVRNCQRSRFGFVARQLCGHHRNIYGQIEIWPPLELRSPRDKFINLASRGINRTNVGKNQMPQAGFEPTTPRSHGRCSNHWATEATTVEWVEYLLQRKHWLPDICSQASQTQAHLLCNLCDSLRHMTNA